MNSLASSEWDDCWQRWLADPCRIRVQFSATREPVREFRIALLPTPFGGLFLAATEKGICQLHFQQVGMTEEQSRRQLLRRRPGSVLVSDPGTVMQHIAGLLFPGSREEIRLDLLATPFQSRVWHALLEIPVGRTVTYGELACRIGQPTGARAVGRAVGANPVALLIPCHRVVPASGGVGSYRWGPARKRRLLTVESVFAERLANRAVFP